MELVKDIVNLNQVRDIFERKKINSVQIHNPQLNKNVELDSDNFKLVKKEIYSIIKTIPQTQIYLTVNIFEKKMVIETKPFIGSA